MANTVVADSCRDTSTGRPDNPVIDWNEYRARLVVFVRGFGGPVAESPEDSAHDIIARATERFHHYDGQHAFSTWLYRLARNHCIDANRNRRRRGEIFSTHAAWFHAETAVMPGPEDALERSETSAVVTRVVEQLPTRDRQLCFLRHYEEMSLAEIGKVMDLPVGTVKYRLHVIARRLQRELERRLA